MCTLSTCKPLCVCRLSEQNPDDVKSSALSLSKRHDCSRIQAGSRTAHSRILHHCLCRCGRVSTDGGIVSRAGYGAVGTICQRGQHASCRDRCLAGIEPMSRQVRLAPGVIASRGPKMRCVCTRTAERLLNDCGSIAIFLGRRPALQMAAVCRYDMRCSAKQMLQS